jgi:hypothetical protein
MQRTLHQSSDRRRAKRVKYSPRRLGPGSEPIERELQELKAKHAAMVDASWGNEHDEYHWEHIEDGGGPDERASVSYSIIKAEVRLSVARRASVRPRRPCGMSRGPSRSRRSRRSRSRRATKPSSTGDPDPEPETPRPTGLTPNRRIWGLVMRRTVRIGGAL